MSRLQSIILIPLFLACQNATNSKQNIMFSINSSVSLSSFGFNITQSDQSDFTIFVEDINGDLLDDIVVFSDYDKVGKVIVQSMTGTFVYQEDRICDLPGDTLIVEGHKDKPGDTFKIPKRFKPSQNEIPLDINDMEELYLYDGNEGKVILSRKFELRIEPN